MLTINVATKLNEIQKMKNILFCFGICLLSILSQAQNGLESIIVEKYYISTAADSIGSIGHGNLPIGSVTYRIYADMLPDYKFQMAYGTANHNLKFTTTTSFFNNTNYGSTSPTFSKTNAAKHTVMLDSWLSVGAACSGNFGILKSEDNGVNNVVNANGILHNTDPAMGIPLTTQDGLIAGTPKSISFIGMDAGQIDYGTADVLGDGTVSGNSMILTGSAWTTLSSGATGPIPATNRVLIAQITTNGVFHYELNIQIGTPSGGIEVYVSSNPVLFNGQMELTIPSLIGTYNGPPTAFAVTGSGSYCQGGSGLAVGLANSELGVTYTLSPGGSTLAGTGSAISFGIKPAGTYTISGTNSKGTTVMTGNAAIVENSPTIPTFNQLGPYCQGAIPELLPEISNNGITGTWNAAISTISPGSTTYNFSPATGSCATSGSMNIQINSPVTPIFTALGPYNQGDTPALLPGTSLNSITGTWSPATINTSVVGLQTYTFTPDAGMCATATDMNVLVNVGSKTLNLKVYLEGLYAGAGTMNQAKGNSGPQFGNNIADKVSIEIHNATSPYLVAYTYNDIDLNVNGTLSITNISGNANGSYYLVVKHRNSVETWSNIPVNFSGLSSISYDFTTSASKAFGNNLKLMSGAIYAIYSGNVTQDNSIDGSDMASVDNAVTSLLMGYHPEDVNGDGVVDASDMAIIDNNVTAIIKVKKP